MDSLGPLDTLDPNIPSRQSNGKLQDVQQPISKAQPPFDRNKTEAPAPKTVTNATGGHSHRPSLTGIPSFQRPRKRVVWRNKACFIALPLEDEFGRKTSKESYLSADEFERRLNDWKTHGFDTNGFTLAPQTSDSHSPHSDGQSRAVHPDPDDEKRERDHGRYRVNIPDRRHWVRKLFLLFLPIPDIFFDCKTCSESKILHISSHYPTTWELAGRNTNPEPLQEAYVNHLKEDKLRALGVDEQIPRNSPSLSVMSRQGSSQSSAVPTSPALAPSSHAGPFPTSFYGAANPASYIGKPVVSHFPRYSIAHPSNEPSLISPNILPHPSQPHIAGTCSPQIHFASQQGSRVASPSVNGHVQTFEEATPSASPIGTSNVGQVSNQVSVDLVARMREHQALLQTQQLQQQQHLYHQQQMLQQRSSPSLGISPNEERILQPVAHQNQAEIVTPIPLNHRQNPSESLQNRVEESELRSSYSMCENEGREGSKGAQIDEGDDKNQAKTVLDEVGGAAPQNARADRSALDASLSVEGTPDHEANIPGQSQSRHPSKNSQLNVNAPKFEPRTLQNSGIFSFLGNQQAHKVIESEIGSFLSSDGAMQAPNGASQPGKWNVAAPAFMPKATVPSREFSFSALRPSLRPDAPTFKPSDSGNAPGPESASEHNAAQPLKKIFGDIAFPEVIKPSKSKAIPITKPNEASKGKEQFDGNMDGQEDESGRITQADGRQKRMRYVDLKTPLDILHFSLSVETHFGSGKDFCPGRTT